MHWPITLPWRSNRLEAERLRSPGLAEGPHLGQERPGRTWLVGDVPDLFGDVGWLDETVIRFVRESRAGPRQVDDRVYHHEGRMHAPRPHLAGNGLGQNSLRRLGWRQAGKAGLAAEGRGVARDQQSSAPCGLHPRRRPPGQVQQGHDIDLEILLEDFWFDVE